MPMPRKRPLADPNQYYAYVWRLSGEVIWVGQGKNNRGRPTTKSSWGGRPEPLLAVLESFRHEILVEVFPCNSKEESEDLERKLIVELSPKYNTAPGKGGWKGMHTEQGLKNISLSARQRECTEEQKKSRSERMIGNQNLLGHVHTEEAREKISKSNKGRKSSQLCKQKSSQRMSERNKTNPPRKGKPCSEEHRRKLSEAAKRRRKRDAS